jgi:hypothetical protein
MARLGRHGGTWTGNIGRCLIETAMQGHVVPGDPSLKIGGPRFSRPQNPLTIKSFPDFWTPEWPGKPAKQATPIDVLS